MSRRRAPGLAVPLALALALAPPAHAGAAPRARAASPKPVAAAPARGPADPVREAYESALAPGLADSTAARLERFVAAHPRSPWAWSAQLELGQIHYARGEYALAHDAFHRARGGAEAEEAAYWEGLASLALGRPRDARDAVNALAHAKKGTPRRWDAAYLVALSFAQEGRRPEALAAYEALLAEPGGSAEAATLFQAQSLARELKARDEADAWARRLLDRYPDSPEAASVRSDVRRAEIEAQAARDAAGSDDAGKAATPGTPARAGRPGDRGGR